MSLSAILDTAWSGLDAASRRLQVVSQNVANAGTAGYAREISSTSAAVAGNAGEGVRLNATGRATDDVLQAGVFHATAQQAALSARNDALAAVDAASGTVASGTDLASRLGALQDKFSALENDPANETAQRAVVAGASDLAAGFNAISAAIGTQRQAAQDGAVASVGVLNTTLYQIGSLTTQIVAIKSVGQSAADLENARDAQLGTLSGLLDVTVLRRDNGNILLASGGAVLPLRPSDGAFSLAPATVAADTPTSAVPPLMLSRTAANVRGGALGGALAVRDRVLPAQQAAVDEVAHTLATRFDAQGLTLFTDPAGQVPVGGTPFTQSGYAGFAGIIGVNPAVSAIPSLVRDGTHGVAGTATGASAFTTGGAAGNTTLIRRVLDYALGSQVQDGVGQPPAAVSGLGVDGTMSTGGQGTGALSTLASGLAAAQATDASNTSSQLGTATTLANTLQTKLTGATGVSVDAELSTMVQLQNAYSANARVLSTVKDMWSDLLAIVR